MKTDPRIDAYIDNKIADFAKPILRHLRVMLHEACPECEETLKWSHPSFIYKGKILASFASFKAHAAFGYWSGSQVVDTGAEPTAMGQFGRLTSLDDLPDRKTLIALTHKAPQDLQAAIDGAPTAKATWDAFPPSCRREYVEWVTEAKRDETRAKRLSQTIEMLSEGKRRNWKYENC